jgi:hypothetical protein
MRRLASGGFSILLVLLALTGCASDNKSSALEDLGPDATDVTETEEDTVEEVEEDVTEDVAEVEDSTDAEVIETTSCVMFPSVGGDIFVSAGGAVEVGVYVYDSDTQDPITDQKVDFEIVEGPEDVEFFNESANSDEDGLAETTFVGGLTPGVATIRAETSCGDAKEFEVEVLELPTGNLRLFFNYPSKRIFSLDSVEVELFLDDSVQCDNLDAGDNPDGQLLTGNAGSVAGSVNFTDLGVDTQYTAVAYGIGPNEERAAWGCVDGITLTEDVTTDETVTLNLLPLDFSGVYRVDSNWNFNEALNSSGPAGQIISQIGQVFIDPGEAIYSLLFDLLDSVFGGLVSGGIEAVLDIFGLDSTIQGAIASIIDSTRDNIAIFDTLFSVGESLANVINNLEVEQRWEVDQTTISAVSSSVVVDAAFNSIQLYWLANPDDPDCNIQNPSNCDPIDIPLDRSSADIGTLDTVFEGQVTNYNQLALLQHSYDFNYLALVQVVLEEFIFPALTGRDAPVFLEDLVYDLVGCEGIGNFVGGGNNDCLVGSGFVGDIVGCVCDEQSTCNSEGCDRCLAIEQDVCIAGLDLVLGPILGGILDSFAVESFLRANGGSAELVNDNADLKVERIIDGSLNSSLNFGEGNSPRVPIVFSGERIGD